MENGMVIDPTAKYWAEGRIIMSGVAAMGGQRLFDADDEEHAERIVRQLNRYDDLHVAGQELIEATQAYASKPNGQTVYTALKVGNLGVAMAKLDRAVGSIK